MAGAEYVDDRKSFEAWLMAQPHASRREIATAMASRIALRALPFLGRRHRLDSSQETALFKNYFWLNAISRTARIWPDLEITTAAAVADTYSSSFTSSNSYIATLFASATAAATAFSLDTVSFAAEYAAVAADDIALETWEQIRNDAAAIETGLTGFGLYDLPLWKSEPVWWVQELINYYHALSTPFREDQHWSVWLVW